MPKPFKVIIALAILLGLILVFQNRQADESSDTLKIGAILPLSGDLTYIGQEMQRGMELALEQNTTQDVTIIYENDQSLSITPAVNALNKLLNFDKVKVIFNAAVNSTKALDPMLSQKAVPGIVIWDSNKTIMDLGDYVFGMGYSTEATGADMAEMAYNKLGIRHISVITAFDEWSEIISRAFMEKFVSLGGIIDLQEKVELSESDLRVNITKIISKNSQAIYFPTFLQSLHSTISQSRDLGFKGHLLTGDTLSDADIGTLGPKAEGIYSAQPYLQDKDFLTKYKNRYGQEANAVNLAFVGMGYDAVNFILAIKNDLTNKNLPITSQNIRDHIVGFEFQGITGKTVFSPARISDKRETILQVKNGVLIKP